VGVAVAVTVGNSVGIRVGVNVGEAAWVREAVGVGVEPDRAVDVNEGETLRVAVRVGVGVGVGEAVNVAVRLAGPLMSCCICDWDREAV